MAAAPAHGEKPPKFSGADFKRWQQKMLFYLTTLGLARFLKDDPPTAKYKTEDKDKEICCRQILEYKMVDTKTVISQVQEIQIILHDLVSEGMLLNESFQSTSKKRKHSGKEKGKAKKFKGNCYNCGKPNHMAKDCRHPKKGNQGGNQQANVTEDKSVPIDLSELDLSAVVFEANMVDNPREWWIDTGATQRKEESSSKRTYETARLPRSDDEEEQDDKRTKVAKSFGPDFLTYMLENEPRTIQEALSSPKLLSTERSYQ
ncbi:hypothetical protein DH2020_022784 [Rehmannia glutinosa]|uniref:CCHC-type domain-containing protein n=1 Tax=Rehmannia glutinosa TaxID=99300 RepID=A0ABR0W6T3_REHGL